MLVMEDSVYDGLHRGPYLAHRNPPRVSRDWPVNIPFQLPLGTIGPYDTFEISEDLLSGCHHLFSDFAV